MRQQDLGRCPRCNSCCPACPLWGSPERAFQSTFCHLPSRSLPRTSSVVPLRVTPRGITLCKAQELSAAHSPAACSLALPPPAPPSHNGSFLVALEHASLFLLLGTPHLLWLSAQSLSPFASPFVQASPHTSPSLETRPLYTLIIPSPLFVFLLSFLTWSVTPPFYLLHCLLTCEFPRLGCGGSLTHFVHAVLRARIVRRRDSVHIG